MLNDPSASQPSYVWEPQPDTWQWLLGTVERICAIDPFCGQLRNRLLNETGTRLVDWLDHVTIAAADLSDQDLGQLGFEPDEAKDSWRHPLGLFPQVIRPAIHELLDANCLGLKVESIDEFSKAHDVDLAIDGEPRSTLRLGRLTQHSLTLVERRGNAGWTFENVTPAQAEAIAHAREQFASRQRPVTDWEQGFHDATQKFFAVSEVLGRDWACSLFFEAERIYWQSRIRAARVQYQRQQRLGMGWANHDHHTYRSSRTAFAALISMLELMGFTARERFYAGDEAGWGAQVMEHPGCGLVVFADVDLAPGEIQGDFAHEGLAKLEEYGTVGMWCQLHGEAAMAAGMHHLECQFDFDAARDQLAAEGVETMAPFTDFPHLRQAFTEGETWDIERAHLDHLIKQGVIDAEQGHRFEQSGARGSHLEILERNDGYKGFNQTGISEIITRTDPRNATA